MCREHTFPAPKTMFKGDFAAISLITGESIGVVVIGLIVYLDSCLSSRVVPSLCPYFIVVITDDNDAMRSHVCSVSD